ncbi:MAG TPA: hypothetical protein VGA84_09535 [Thermoanaerobaculia bacterium]
MNIVFGCLAIAGIGILVVAIVAFAIASMKRSHGKHGTSGSLSAAMTNIESMFHEGKGDIVEAMQSTREDERDTDGDPPER